MSRRAFVTLLAVVIAVAVAIPAFADSGTTAKTTSVRGLSTRALGKAKSALRIGRAAKREVHKAVAAAGTASGSASAAQASAAAAKTAAGEAAKATEGAQERAGGARLKAEEAQKEVASIRSKVGFAEGDVSTASKTFQSLAGGPAVTVDVLQAGLVQVWAQALIDGEGAVSLYEGAHQVEGQASECNGVKGVLFQVEAAGPLLAGTPAAFDSSGACATLGAPGPVLFRATAGEHTFELRYASAGGSATFSERRLVVAPLP
jgi:hypothetical protein